MFKWLISIMIDEKQLNSWQTGLISKMMDFILDLFKIKYFCYYSPAPEEEPDDLYFKAMEQGLDPRGLHLTEAEYERLKHRLFNLYEWTYDKVKEQPVPEHSIKFEDVVDCCDIIKFNPDPNRVQRIKHKRYGNG